MTAKPAFLSLIVAIFLLPFLFLLAFIPFRAAADGLPTLAVLGDSLTAGLGLAEKESFPARLEQALTARGHHIRVINAGVSGDTSKGGLERLDWVIGPEVDAVILELGANDMLRGIDPEETERNLDALITRLKEREIAVLLAGMRAAPNLGAAYGRAFDGLFPRLAARHEILLYPFFLEGVAADPALNQEDGIHPNAKGVEVIVAGILPHVETLLAQLAEKKP